MTLVLGLAVIAVAVYAVFRKVDVRLALVLAGLVLGIIAGRPAVVVSKFFATFTAAEYIIPICSAMGFAYVPRQTLCDQHLVHLLVHPLRHARTFLIPGAVVVGFLVNMPIVSQTSAAVAVGSVLIPLLLAARISRVTAGAALLLGASLGGELLNQGAPEYRTVTKTAGELGTVITGASLVNTALPLVLVQLGVTTLVFWWMSVRAERAHAKEVERAEVLEAAHPEPHLFKVSLLKAAVPVVPLVLLFLTSPPLQLIRVPHHWLVWPADMAGFADPAKAAASAFDARLIGAAMLIGVAVAALTDPRAVPGLAKAFFEGAGYAFTHVIAIIVAAACFGEGVKQIGLASVIGTLVRAWPDMLLPAAGFLPLLFALVSGSGIAATQSLYPFFAAPAAGLQMSLQHVGAMVSLGAAAGRTMSPVAAVTLMSADLAETDPAELVKRVAVPLLVGTAAVVLVAMGMSWTSR